MIVFSFTWVVWCSHCCLNVVWCVGVHIMWHIQLVLCSSNVNDIMWSNNNIMMMVIVIVVESVCFCCRFVATGWTVKSVNCLNCVYAHHVTRVSLTILFSVHYQLRKICYVVGLCCVCSHCLVVCSCWTLRLRCSTHHSNTFSAMLHNPQCECMTKLNNTVDVVLSYACA